MKAYKRIIALTLCALTCVCNVTYVRAEETTETNEATETNGAANSGVVENATTGETVSGGEENDTVESNEVANSDVGESETEEQAIEENFFLYAKNADGQTIQAYYDAKTNQYYFFMMASDSKNVTLTYVDNNKHQVTKDVSFDSNDTCVLEDALNGPITVVYKKSSLPSLYIDLKDTTLDTIKADKNIKYPGNTVILGDSSGTSSFTNVEIKGRGNTSWTSYDKKGYQIKFDKKTSLFGMGKAKKWVLLANSSDDSLLKNYIALSLAQNLNSQYSIHCQYVDLWIGGEYQGNYLVTEKAEINSSRVNLQYEYGILAEWDDAFYKQEDHWFENSILGAKFAVKETVNEDEEHVQKAISIFNDSLTDFYSTLLNTKKKDITIDLLKQYIDVDSFVQYYLVNEYMLNEESVTTSFFWYKDGANDVIHLGPVWDFDSCMNYYGSSNELYIYQRNLFSTLLSIPAFSEYISNYYNSNKSYFDNASTLASNKANEIQSSVDMNYIRWDTLGKPNGKGGYVNHSTWQGAVNTTVTWLQQRSKSFYIPKLDGFDFVLNKKKDKMTIRYYPTKSYSSIRFAIWSEDSNQTDLKWFDTKKESNGSFYTEVNLDSFKKTGTFIMHVYSGANSITGTTFYVDSIPGGMHRLYNPNSGEHFYTEDTNEKNWLVSLGWISEGIGWIAPNSSDYPVYRLYNANGGEHHYTMNKAEKDMLVKAGWKYEGIGWYSADPNDKSSVPLLREYNPNAFANNHNYTVNKAEHEWLVSLGWKDEGKAWYAVD